MTDSAKPKWEELSVQWNWIAQDSNGRWMIFQERPFPMSSGWQARKGACIGGDKGLPNGDWLYTLEERPVCKTFSEIEKERKAQQDAKQEFREKVFLTALGAIISRDTNAEQEDYYEAVRKAICYSNEAVSQLNKEHDL